MFQSQMINILHKSARLKWRHLAGLEPEPGNVDDQVVGQVGKLLHPFDVVRGCIQGGLVLAEVDANHKPGNTNFYRGSSNMRVDSKIEYEDLEKLNLESPLTTDVKSLCLLTHKRDSRLNFSRLEVLVFKLNGFSLNYDVMKYFMFFEQISKVNAIWRTSVQNLEWTKKYCQKRKAQLMNTCFPKENAEIKWKIYLDQESGFDSLNRINLSRTASCPELLKPYLKGEKN